MLASFVYGTDTVLFALLGERVGIGAAVGIVLSGMGSDGTSGLAAIHRAGGVTMVQDRDSSIVYGMPQSCIDLGVAQRVVPLDSIARSLVSEVEQLRIQGRG